MPEPDATSTLNDDKAGSSPADAHIDTQNTGDDDEITFEGDPIESAGLISTAEFEIKTDPDDSAQGDNSQASASAGDSDDSSKDGADEDKTYTAEELKKLDATFQDSPRFKELMKERTNLKASRIKSDAQVSALSDQVTNLTNLVSGKQTPNQQVQNSPAFTDITTMTDEKIIESFESDPKGFLTNFAIQLSTEIQNTIGAQFNAHNQKTAQVTSEGKVQKLYDDYEKANPDFVEMWEENQIQDYMDENPGLTPIAAHKLMKSDSKSSSQEDIDKAVKAAREDERKKIKSKHNVRVIGAGGHDSANARNGKTPADLANTKQHGGLTSVLAARSAARRAQQ
jgi:hypothetical protein